MSSERPVDTPGEVTQTQRLEAAGMWLLRLQEDSLTENEIADWIRWCELDASNLQAFEQMRSLWQVAPDHLPQVRPPRWRPSMRSWGALAACLALTVVAGAVFLLDQRRSEPERVAREDLVQTAVAQNQPAILPDGSHLEMGASSIVAVDFTGRTRRLQLRSGEAFFQVKHDKTRPFVVEVGDLRIVAVGTAFNVRRSGTQVAVTVQEGVVEVSGSEAAARAQSDDRQPKRVATGEQLVVNVVSGEIRESAVDPAVAVAWRDGRLEFTGDSLDTVVASVNRYSRRSIRLSDPALGELSFTGTVFLQDIDAWLDGLQQVFPVQVDRSASAEVVLDRRQ